MSSCLINENTSLKQQLLVSYLLISLISAGITLGVCYGLLYALSETASTDASNNLINQTNLNADALASEIANSINQEITSVGESICMMSAQFGSILLTYAHSGNGSTILKEVLSVYKQLQLLKLLRILFLIAILVSGILLRRQMCGTSLSQ